MAPRAITPRTRKQCLEHAVVEARHEPDHEQAPRDDGVGRSARRGVWRGASGGGGGLSKRRSRRTLAAHARRRE